MENKNLDFLKDSLKYLGFGDKLNADLEAKMNEQPSEFKLLMTAEYKKGEQAERMSYQLDFRKSDKTEMYFFNRYEATLKTDDATKDKSQTFYITKNAGVTAKEAYNLLSGRAVNKDLTNKEGQPYNAWLQLDFTEKDKNNFKVKQYTPGYGYELEKVFAKYPIKELADAAQKEKLVKSLEKGNLTQVTFTKEGKDEKMFIEANPQYKSLTVYDASMKRQYQENEKKEVKQELDKDPDKKQTVKKGVDEEDEGTSQKKSKRRGVGV